MVIETKKYLNSGDGTKKLITMNNIQAKMMRRRLKNKNTHKVSLKMINPNSQINRFKEDLKKSLLVTKEEKKQKYL